MSIIVSIDAILDRRPEQLRTAFEGQVGSKAITHPKLVAVISYEFFLALRDDIAPMPLPTCKALKLPEGSTYARGAEFWLKLCRRQGTETDRRRVIPGHSASVDFILS